jgi:hypothetical protein
MDTDLFVSVMALIAAWCVLLLLLVALSLRRAALRMRCERMAVQPVRQPFVTRRGE